MEKSQEKTVNEFYWRICRLKMIFFLPLTNMLRHLLENVKIKFDWNICVWAVDSFVPYDISWCVCECACACVYMVCIGMNILTNKIEEKKCIYPSKKTNPFHSVYVWHNVLQFLYHNIIVAEWARDTTHVSPTRKKKHIQTLKSQQISFLIFHYYYFFCVRFGFNFFSTLHWCLFCDHFPRWRKLKSNHNYGDERAHSIQIS